MTRLGVKACIWDMDHTLYHWEATTIPGFHEALTAVLRQRGVTPEQMGDDDIASQADYHFVNNGSSYPYFVERFGLQHDDLAAATPQLIDPIHVPRCDELPELFKVSGYKHVINTHASRNWVAKVLARLGLESLFSADDIIYSADHGFVFKRDSIVTHEVALKRTGQAAEDVVMIDDAAANLLIPKEMGMKTVLMNNGKKPVEKPSHVDAVVTHARDVFTLLA